MITVIALLIAVDPVGLARVWPRRLEVAAVVAVALAAAVLLADPALRLLDLSPEGFWMAAVVVLLMPGVGRLISPTTRDVAGPAAVLVAIALATRDGVGLSLVAAAVAAAGVALATTFVRDARWVPVIERVVGAAMVVIAVQLVVDGVLAV